MLEWAPADPQVPIDVMTDEYYLRPLVLSERYKSVLHLPRSLLEIWHDLVESNSPALFDAPDENESSESCRVTGL